MRKRPTATSRGYDAHWRKARTAFLRDNPTCTHPGCARPATCVHHSVPHRGDRAKFWNKSTWQPRCDEHHNRDEQQREARGYTNRLGSDGLPIDPNHPFNRAEAS